MIGSLCRTAIAASRFLRRGPVAPASPGSEAKLCLGAGVLIDQLVGWVALQVKADRMCEDGMAIGGAQLPRAQHSAGVGVSPAQRGSDEWGEPGDQRPDLLRGFGKGGGPALLQQCYGDPCFAVGTLGFTLAVRGDWRCGGRRIGCRRWGWALLNSSRHRFPL